jgi:hypothetical protein
MVATNSEQREKPDRANPALDPAKPALDPIAGGIRLAAKDGTRIRTDSVFPSERSAAASAAFRLR